METTTETTTKHYEIPSFWDILLSTDQRFIHLPPSLQIEETKDDRDYVDWLLCKHWKPDVSRAFLNQHPEDIGKEFTYGEVTTTGARQLMEDMGLLTTTVTEGAPEEGEEARTPVVFYDLGSGEGKLVVQVFIETLEKPASHRIRVNLEKAVGIELSPARHTMAEKSWKDLQIFLRGNGDATTKVDVGGKDSSPGDENNDSSKTTLLQPEQRQVAHRRLQEKMQSSSSSSSSSSCSQRDDALLQLHHGNLLDYDFSDATHIYASSIFFPPNVLLEMSQKIIDYATKYGRIKVVAALSDLELFEEADAGGICNWEKQVQRLQMSWGGANVRLYTPKDY